ncbi:quinol dehydrogenase ferredoxin subunit NapH [Shewanella sp. YIC-542]|uniref:quinol dehydrogenase ferredoxin subunit NapH n=1 Tax=Shewanella mytili TaxID=3377111 RepID=UPI00398EDBCF
MSRTTSQFAAPAKRGFWRARRFLLLRRTSQLAILALFALGPWAGIWLLRGNLSASVLLDTVPLADPLTTLQVLLSGHLPQSSLLIGAGLIGLFYALLGGRVFCSWVCPVNIITDLAAWLRRALKLPRTPALPGTFRYVMLVLVLLLPILSGMLVWEWLNPVPLLYRALLFGNLGGLGILLAIFMADLLLAERLWCAHVCPTGALYALLGKLAPIKVVAVNAEACNNCMDCFSVCPERQLLKPALKGKQPVISSGDCTLCGRCIDVCTPEVFQYKNRYSKAFQRVAHKAEKTQ